MPTVTRRTRRVGALIRLELSQLLLRRVKDPRLKEVTITEVRVSPDLRQAKVFYSLLDTTRVDETQRGFEKASPFLRRELAARLQMKVTPRLVPVYDDSLARGADLEALIRRVRAADRAAAAARGEDEEGAA